MTSLKKGMIALGISSEIGVACEALSFPKIVPLVRRIFAI
jgi:hypothetical protein